MIPPEECRESKAGVRPATSRGIVGETFGSQYTAYDIGADATLSNARTWASVPGTFPDGCTIDEAGGIWFSDAAGKQVVRVVEGGEITDHLPTPDNTYACMLGGDDGRTLFALTSIDGHPDKADGTATGTLISTTVDIPRVPEPATFFMSAAILAVACIRRPLRCPVKVRSVACAVRD